MKLTRTNYRGLLFIAPFFIFYLIFNLYPIIHTLLLSFYHYDGYKEPVFIGIKNYLGLFVDKFFWQSFFNTWKIWFPNIIMQLVLALLFSVLFTNIRLKIKGVGFYRAVFYFPNLVTAASIALLFVVVLDWQHGALNQILFGSDSSKYINWMIKPWRARMVVSIIQTWMWFGHSMILLMAGLQGIPSTYYEAAQIDGAKESQIFFRITLPLLMPILTYVVITSLIGGMQIFDIPYVISITPGVAGTGEAERALVTMVTYVYNTAFKYNRLGYASAVSYLLFVIIALFSFIYLKIINIKFKEAV